MSPVPLRFKPLSPSPRGSSNPGSPALAIQSPCISICQMDARAGLCRGCGRTIEEITLWSRLDEESKRAVWDALPARGYPGLDTGP